jgi:hypothetical protein
VSCEWDGTPDAAELLVENMARNIVDSVSTDPQEEDDWHAIFERRS